MRNYVAFAVAVSIMIGLNSCGTTPDRQAAPTEHAAPVDTHRERRTYIEACLKEGLIHGWELQTIEESNVPSGWVSDSGKGWHVVLLSAPDREASDWRVSCHFWVFAGEWVGRKRPLAAGSRDATAFYYGQNDRLMLFVQPPVNPAMTQIAVGQVALALGVPDMRALAASQRLGKVREMQKRLAAAADVDSRAVPAMVDRMIETGYAVITSVRGRNNDDTEVLLRMLRRAFPDKKTFVIHRVGPEYQDSIVACGRP